MLLAVLLLLGLLAGPFASVAQASTPDPVPTTTTLTFSGRLTAGRDTAGYFGPWGSNLAGKSFTATYKVVTFANSSVGAGIDSLALSNPLSTTMTFSITVNGRTRTATATTMGTASTFDGVAGLFSGGYDQVSATALNTRAIGNVTQTFEMNTMVQSAANNILSDGQTSALSNTTYTVLGGDLASGQFAFRQSPGSPAVLAYGLMAIQSLSITSVVPPPVAAVPEAGEWAMLMAGLGVVALAARRRRGRA